LRNLRRRSLLLGCAIAGYVSLNLSRLHAGRMALGNNHQVAPRLPIRKSARYITMTTAAAATATAGPGDKPPCSTARARPASVSTTAQVTQGSTR
jgi:hypothetical protein